MRPTFTIIVPTYNRQRALARCLNAIAGLSYPADCFDVVVVDDGSDRPQDEVVDSYRAKLPVKLIRTDNAGAAAARNVGASHATGSFLAFLDDDCAPTASWLQALGRAAQQLPDRLLGGHTRNALHGNRYSRASQQLVDYIYSRAEHPPFFTGNNMALAAAKFEQIGGFDRRFMQMSGEDRDLCSRWQRAGHRLHYVPEAIIDHYREMTAGSFWRQHLNYGRGARRYHRLRTGASLSTVQPRFYVGLLRYAHALPTRRQERIVLSGLLLLSQLAYGCGYLMGDNHAR